MKGWDLDMSTRQKKVLFVCTGNTCRSPMAEALLKKELQNKGLTESFQVISAGIAALTGEAASAEAVLAMEEQGLDIKGHQADLLTKELIAASDLIITMTIKHKEAILSLLPESVNKVFTLKELAVSEASAPFLSELKKIDQEAALALTRFRQEAVREEGRLIEKKMKLVAQLQNIDEGLRQLADEEAALLTTFSEKRQDLIKKENLPLDIQDPFGKSLPVYKETSKEIQAYILKALTKILKLEEKEKQ